MKSELRIAVATLAAVFVVGASASLAKAAETLSYTVTRDGSTIGTHAVTIDQSGAQTKVGVETDIAVKVLFVTAYKFKHASQELWSNGDRKSTRLNSSHITISYAVFCLKKKKNKKQKNK